MPLSPQLLDSYWNTVYWVETPDRCYPLRIGQSHPEFDSLIAQRGAPGWVFITACNPQSQLLAPAENRRRMVELEQALSGETFWPGLGVGLAGDWFPEASVCALVPWERGLELARRFEQHAIVAGRAGEPAMLLPLE